MGLRDLAALWYLEFRQLLNRLRQGVRQPARLLIYLLAIAYLVTVAILRSSRRQPLPFAQIPEPYASAAFFAFLVVVGLIAENAASGIVGGFASAADARFLIGSRLLERTVISWLQLRRSSSTLFRTIVFVLFYVFFLGISFRVLGFGLAWIAGSLLVSACRIPVLKLSVVTGKRRVGMTANALALAGVLSVAVLLASLRVPALLPSAHIIEHLGAGVWVNQLAAGNTIAVGVFYAVAVVLVASALFCQGLYPELYAATMNRVALRVRVGASGIFKRHAYQTSRSVRLTAQYARLGAVGAAWAIVWKENLGFVRARSTPVLFAVSLLASAATGTFLANLAKASRDPVRASVGLAIAFMPILVLFLTLGSAVGLREDIGKPLWWMGRDPLGLRLFAWVLSRSWWPALCFAIGIIAWSVLVHFPPLAIVGVPLSVVTVLNLRAIGLTLYALFPSALDQRGPLAALRALLAYCLLGPPILSGALFGGFMHGVTPGIVAGICTSLTETALLIAFAARQIAGRGAAVAQAESL
ncbi:MAG: hypothetical protein JO092_10885 [Candidatus Eremiobacteraeota bacterium]|nr:hypothetical protein [Candidatus Eremiobacteraeota bacterium]